MKHAADYDTAGSSDGDARRTKLSKHACGSTIALLATMDGRDVETDCAVVKGRRVGLVSGFGG